MDFWTILDVFDVVFRLLGFLNFFFWIFGFLKVFEKILIKKKWFLGIPFKVTKGQTFCDLQTLLHTFFGFSGACCRVIFLIFWVERWTFAGI